MEMEVENDQVKYAENEILAKKKEKNYNRKLRLFENIFEME